MKRDANGRFEKGTAPPGPGRQKGSSDHLPRGSVHLMYRTLLDDDGTLERSLKGDRSFRASALRMMLNAIDDPKTGLPLLEEIADRLEGKPVQRVAVTDPQPIEIHLHTDEGTIAGDAV